MNHNKMIFYYQLNQIVYLTTNKNLLQIMQLLSCCHINILFRFILFQCKLQTTIANYVWELKQTIINSTVLCKIYITKFKLLITI